jgi:hypothetical protein
MASDSDWVEDVRRWVSTRQASSNLETPVDGTPGAEPYDLGYEAAHPALQARHWPDALGGASATVIG